MEGGISWKVAFQFAIPQPYLSTKDIFALRNERRTDGYRSISLHGTKLKVPNGDCYIPVDIRLSPGRKKETIDLRFWSNQNFLGSQTISAKVLPTVHF